MFRTAGLVGLALTALAPAAHADVFYESPSVVAARVEPHRDRVYLGVGYVGTAMIDRNAMLGDGMSLALGVNLSRNVALELGVLATGRSNVADPGADGFVLAAATLDAKVRLARGAVSSGDEFAHAVTTEGSVAFHF